METTYYSSPIGTLQITGSDLGIRSILYVDNELETGLVPVGIADCIHQLDEYFAGKRTEFDILIDPEGTEFQKKAVRAVGHASGLNKINIVIPCHRVIGANGKLTGYGGGLWRKKWLLKHEASLQMPGLFSMIR